jgi:hypothetical protein
VEIFSLNVSFQEYTLYGQNLGELMKNDEFPILQVKGLALLTSREFNGQPYRQDPPVSAPISMATTFAT